MLQQMSSIQSTERHPAFCLSVAARGRCSHLSWHTRWPHILYRCCLESLKAAEGWLLLGHCSSVDKQVAEYTLQHSAKPCQQVLLAEQLAIKHYRQQSGSEPKYKRFDEGYRELCDECGTSIFNARCDATAHAMATASSGAITLKGAVEDKQDAKIVLLAGPARLGLPGWACSAARSVCAENRWRCETCAFECCIQC